MYTQEVKIKERERERDKRLLETGDKKQLLHKEREREFIKETRIWEIYNEQAHEEAHMSVDGDA